MKKAVILSVFGVLVFAIIFINKTDKTAEEVVVINQEAKLVVTEEKAVVDEYPEVNNSESPYYISRNDNGQFLLRGRTLYDNGDWSYVTSDHVAGRLQIDIPADHVVMENVDGVAEFALLYEGGNIAHKAYLNKTSATNIEDFLIEVKERYKNDETAEFQVTKVNGVDAILFGSSYGHLHVDGTRLLFILMRNGWYYDLPGHFFDEPSRVTLISE